MKTLFAIAILLLIVGLPVAHYSLASVEARNFHAVTPGKMYRSGQMTPAGLSRTLDEHGIGTVISFRDARDGTAPPPDEFEEALCREKGVVYHRLMPLRWSMPDGTVPATANVAKFLEILRDPATPRPILVHCFAGIHRTGVFTAIYRMEFEGWSSEEAIREMREMASIRTVFPNDLLEFITKYQPTRK